MNLRNSKRIFNILFSSLLFFSSFLVLTCTPGLGTQVDTKSPSVYITSPSTKSTLNSAFTVTGTASDDLAVSKVTVTFKDIATSKTYGPFSANLSEGNWSLDVRTSGKIIDLNGEKLPDGDYNVTVSASDASGHVSAADVVYTVDTTPPTVLLTSPTSYATTPQFSKTITVKGEVYDKTTKDMMNKSLVPDGYERTNIWRFNPETKSKHPAPFPIELPKNLIQRSCLRLKDSQV